MRYVSHFWEHILTIGAAGYTTECLSSCQIRRQWKPGWLTRTQSCLGEYSLPALAPFLGRNYPTPLHHFCSACREWIWWDAKSIVRLEKTFTWLCSTGHAREFNMSAWNFRCSSMMSHHDHCRAFKTLCEPYNAEDLHWFPVDPKMNNARVDSPEVCQPLKRRPITAFFKTAGSQYPIEHVSRISLQKYPLWNRLI